MRGGGHLVATCFLVAVGLGVGLPGLRGRPCFLGRALGLDRLTIPLSPPLSRTPGHRGCVHARFIFAGLSLAPGMAEEVAARFMVTGITVGGCRLGEVSGLPWCTVTRVAREPYSCIHGPEIVVRSNPAVLWHGTSSVSGDRTRRLPTTAGGVVTWGQFPRGVVCRGVGPVCNTQVASLRAHRPGPSPGVS